MTQFVNDESDEAEDKVFQHPSYGMISVHHRSGGGPLFGVDYPTHHSVSLTISTGEVKRQLAGEWFYEREQLIVVEMSEVQYARMIATPNSSGVPCTLKRVRKGPMEQVDNPPDHMADEQTWKDEIKGKARKIGGNLERIRMMTQGFLDKPPTKAQLKELAHWAQQTQQAIESDMPFLAGRMEEQVDEGLNYAKTEVDAYIHMQLAELGRETVREQIAKGGVAISIGGKRTSPQKLLTKGDDNE
jgi:hypothetical protein